MIVTRLNSDADRERRSLFILPEEGSAIGTAREWSMK
jgi:hypothetical protein